MYGQLVPAHAREIAERARGCVVLDLGSGDGERTRMLARTAQRVIAIDSKTPARILRSLDNVVCHQMRFREVAEAWPALGVSTPYTVHLSWPWCDTLQASWLAYLCKGAEQVLYVGCNTGGTACGSPGLFRSWLYRAVDAYLPAPENVLIVYGAARTTPRRQVYFEELATTAHLRMECLPFSPTTEQFRVEPDTAWRKWEVALAPLVISPLFRTAGVAWLQHHPWLGAYLAWVLERGLGVGRGVVPGAVVQDAAERLYVVTSVERDLVRLSVPCVSEEVLWSDRGVRSVDELRPVFPTNAL